MELTRSIRLRRLQCVGHVMRMEDERVPKKVLKGYTETRRPVGPRGRWLDAVDRDGERMLKCRKWRRSAEDRDAWRQRSEEAKTQVGLQCHTTKTTTTTTITTTGGGGGGGEVQVLTHANHPIIWATKNLWRLRKILEYKRNKVHLECWILYYASISDLQF